MNRKIQLLLPECSEVQFKLPFAAAGIDSMDLVSLRVEVEQFIGFEIPDSVWLDFISVGDIIDFCEQSQRMEKSKKLISKYTRFEQNLSIEMPQMAVEALSENWLFKELGNQHWQLLCKGLHANSHDLKDELGNRLYATFVRIRMIGTVPLNFFKENQQLFMQGEMNRFGSSLYFSEMQVECEGAIMRANLMTSFTNRNNADNTQLSKSQPLVFENDIAELPSNPFFAEEYRAMKKGELNKLVVNAEEFIVGEYPIFEYTYRLNPYYDLNGVGLLYFASFPIINDVGEAAYFNERNASERYELTYFTLSRDIFYFANCNIQDEIIYKLFVCENLDTQTLKLSSALYRKSDKLLMARIFTQKKKKV